MILTMSGSNKISRSTGKSGQGPSLILQPAFAGWASARQPSFVAPACLAEAREASEGWRARQDSNLQPDRYERRDNDRSCLRLEVPEEIMPDGSIALPDEHLASLHGIVEFLRRRKINFLLFELVEFIEDSAGAAKAKKIGCRLSAAAMLKVPKSLLYSASYVGR
ncbi:hypothetical protein [Bradyrhizobium sp. 23]|uniref:hypothetical protein n=1 Tax=Bradyrhizobium sp. 23 TaxID=2782667 RepID=UPI001FF82B83|nr:hypothetical protein [Bradyrhizobium sp. 23]MCK1317452.1 hypothetical protein [Bradyrhizobium sp. 23]